MSEFEISPFLFFFIGLAPILCAQTALIIFKKFRGMKISDSHEFLKFVFAVYILFAAALCFFPIDYVVNSLLSFNPQVINLNPIMAAKQLFGDSINPHPSVLLELKTIAAFFVGNLLLLFPFGLLIPLLAKSFRSFVPLFLLGLIVSIAVATIQFVFSAYSISVVRTIGINNVILNVVGLCFGFFLYRKFFPMQLD